MAGIDILKMPGAADFIEFGDNFGQRFLVTLDTEEEFDWGAPLDREAHSLRSIPALGKFQQFCEGFGVPPIYFLDYPVASSALAGEILREAVQAGRADIGAHLHPWVTPPFDEEVSEFNSFSGNLPEELERNKFGQLRDAIEANFGITPLINRAGRYGIGANTAAILSDKGIAIDSSVRPLFDYAAIGGVDFRNHPLRPYWIDRDASLMELPLTTSYWGPLRQLGGWLYPLAGRLPHLRGALARAGMLERIPLTPEGITADEAIRSIDIALDDGLPLLVFSFHSPSLQPGHTPYVRNDDDLDRFYDWWRRIFAYLAQRDIMPAGVKDVMASVSLA